jgi:hypothetical protein
MGAANRGHSGAFPRAPARISERNSARAARRTDRVHDPHVVESAPPPFVWIVTATARDLLRPSDHVAIPRLTRRASSSLASCSTMSKRPASAALSSARARASSMGSGLGAPVTFRDDSSWRTEKQAES